MITIDIEGIHNYLVERSLKAPKIQLDEGTNPYYRPFNNTIIINPYDGSEGGTPFFDNRKPSFLRKLRDEIELFPHRIEEKFWKVDPWENVRYMLEDKNELVADAAFILAHEIGHAQKRKRFVSGLMAGVGMTYLGIVNLSTHFTAEEPVNSLYGALILGPLIMLANQVLYELRANQFAINHAAGIADFITDSNDENSTRTDV